MKEIIQALQALQTSKATLAADEEKLEEKCIGRNYPRMQKIFFLNLLQRHH